MIGERKPAADAVADRLPIMDDELMCLDCTTVFLIFRHLGTDWRNAQCPTCGSKNLERERDAPWVLRTIN